MKKDNLPLILIIGSLILFVLNFIFTSDEMNSRFWMKIISNLLLILAMLLIIRDRKKHGENKKG
jgi:ribose/xylose/arabinose/galactoside ABC-type transport system permease subunit